MKVTKGFEEVKVKQDVIYIQMSPEEHRELLHVVGEGYISERGYKLYVALSEVK